MDNLTVACVQHRMSIPATRDEFESGVRRYLRQAQSKAAQITIFPEQTGTMLAPPLVSGFKLGFIKQADKAKQPRAGLFRRGVGGVSGAAASALGGGFRGSMGRLVRKKSDELRDVYFEVFGDLAREFGTAIVGGSLYLTDEETGTVRNRAYLFDADGQVLGFQDKFNLTQDEQDLAVPGDELSVFQTRFGRLGLLIGRDALYPELARLLAIKGADLIVGISASPGVAQGRVLRSALALRAEENQVFTAACFMLGPNHMGRDNRDEYFGQSALMSPISLTTKGDGILVQAGSSRTESMIATDLDIDALYGLRETSRFRPRQEMHLGSYGPVLGEMYEQSLTIDQAAEKQIAGPPPPEPKLFHLEPESDSEAAQSEDVVDEPPEVTESQVVVPPPPSVPEAMSLSRSSGPEEDQT